MSSSRMQLSLSLLATLNKSTSVEVATYNFEALNAKPETPTVDPDNPELPPVKRVFCLAPRSRLKSPRNKCKVPLSNPTATKFKSSSTANAVGTCPEA